MTNIATRIETICSSIIAKDREYINARATMGRSALLKQSAIDKRKLKDYMLLICESLRVKPSAIVKIMR